MNVDETNAKILLERLFLRYGDDRIVIDDADDPKIVIDDAVDPKIVTNVTRFQKSLDGNNWMTDDNVKAFFDMIDVISDSKTVDSLSKDEVLEKQTRFAGMLETKNTIFFPRNWGTHWTLGVVSRAPDTKQLTFRHHDSLPVLWSDRRARETFEFAKRLLGVSDDRIKFDEVTSTANQGDGCSCGVYVCLFATMETFFPWQTLDTPIEDEEKAEFRKQMSEGVDSDGIHFFGPAKALTLVAYAADLVRKNRGTEQMDINAPTFEFRELNGDLTLSDPKVWRDPRVYDNGSRVFVEYETYDGSYSGVLVNVETLPKGENKNKVLERIREFLDDAFVERLARKTRVRVNGLLSALPEGDGKWKIARELKGKTFVDDEDTENALRASIEDATLEAFNRFMKEKRIEAKTIIADRLVRETRVVVGHQLLKKIYTKEPSDFSAAIDYIWNNNDDYVDTGDSWGGAVNATDSKGRVDGEARGGSNRGQAGGSGSVISGSFALSIGDLSSDGDGDDALSPDMFKQSGSPAEMFKAGPDPESPESLESPEPSEPPVPPEPKRRVWSSIHDIASGADALFGLGPFATRDAPPAPDANDDDPVLLEAQMWLSA